MGSYYGTCEIVEAGEELKPVQRSEGEYRLHSGLSAGDNGRNPCVVKLGYKGSLEDDINQLFDAINVKGPKGLGASSSTLKKNALRKPITVGMPHSPRIGDSEPLSLKQALRDLCISKASEMAAMKRLSMSTGSPQVSVTGRIKSLLNSVVVEAASGSGHPRDEDKGDMVEVSLVPEESKSSSSRILDMPHQAPKNKSSTQTDVSNSREVGIQAPKADDTTLESDNSVPASTKLPKSASMSKSGRRGRLKYAVASSSTINRNRTNRMTNNEPRVAKSIVRYKTSVKTKMKQGSLSVACVANNFNEVNSSFGSTTSQLLCQRCHCCMKSSNNESNQDSTKLQSPGISAEVSSSHVNSDVHKPDLIEHSRNLPVIPRANKSPKSRGKGDFSQCSNSHGDSSSTSIGNDSNLTGSNCGNRPHMSMDAKWEAIRHVRMQEGVLGLRHFNLLKKLGCGDIGTVYLAELTGTSCLFAIKVMDNEYLARRKKMPRAQTEREILSILDHPFLPTLYTQFTSDNLSCLVMEYCPGGDLHVLRQRQPERCFPESAARFYVAEVLLALEYLHMLGIIYRDLKPENILVREDGHIMLTDFDLSLRCTVTPTLVKSPSNINTARISGACTASSCAEPFCIVPSCQVSCFGPKFYPAGAKTSKIKPGSLPQLVAEPTDARSNSFVGTHEYLAPEIIKGEGHGAAVDWWTFGIFLYELLYGRTPFKGAGNEETLANVVLQSLKFPDSPLVSFQARDLIRELLVKEPENRLGAEKGAAKIKQHPFFEGLNWALIRCTIPPELPAYYEFAVQSTVSPGTVTNSSECKTTGEHLEFEFF